MPPPAPVAGAGGGTAITAGVLALLIGAYRAFATYGYIAAAAMFAGMPSEYASYIRGTQAYVTIAAVLSAVGTLVLIVGAIKLFNRRLGGRGLITLGCLIAIADVVATWIAVSALMNGMSGLFSSLGESPGSIFSQALGEQLPFIVLNVALGAGGPLLTIILAWTQSTRRWCEAPRFPFVAGSQTPVAAPPADPHADYYRQAAQQFSPPPTNKPPSPAGALGALVPRLMDKGVRGELFAQPWFQKIRAESPDPFVYITYGGGIFVSILVYLIPSMFISTVLTTLLWLAIGYLYFAVGTKIAHQFLLFGICCVGALVMAWRAFGVLSLMSFNSGLGRLIGASFEPMPILLLVLLINVAGAAFLVYVGVQVYREIQRLSAP